MSAEREILDAARDHDRVALRRLAYRHREEYGGVISRAGAELTPLELRLVRDQLPPPPGSGPALWMDEEPL